MEYGSGNTAVKVLEGINIDIEEGEIVSIIGKSGVGKSTLLNIVSGLIKPTKGSVRYKEKDIVSLKDKEMLKMRLDNFGFVFQDFQLVNSLTAKDNILLPGLASKGKVDEKYFEDVIRTLGIEDKLNSLPAQLSGGEQQRVAIARALINRPKVVFADEPTGNLDRINSDIVFELLFKCVKQQNITLLYVTHDEERAAMADVTIEIYDRKIKIREK